MRPSEHLAYIIVNDADGQYLSRAVVNDVIGSIHPFITSTMLIYLFGHQINLQISQKYFIQQYHMKRRE